MKAKTQGGIRAAQVVLPCSDLDATLDFFTGRLGFRVEAVYPADTPRVAVVAGHGLRVRLDRGVEAPPGVLQLLCDHPEALAPGATELVAPNGTRVQLVDADPPIVLPEVQPSFVVSRRNDESGWHTGRAGMRYRDLVPDRQGGAFIASHIEIPEAGPVPDYVHYHKVRFQMIFCYRGWVRVVYEDQGPPFVLRAGDCVLQPPRIRHRVLESSGSLEVVEIGHPAEHETLADLELELPTSAVSPDRDFGGQRFARHEAAKASWRPFRLEGFERRDTGIGEATKGIASVQVARRRGSPPPIAWSHDADFLFDFVLEGELTLQREDDEPLSLVAGDAFVLPRGERFRFERASDDLEILEVALPEEFTTRRVGGR